MLDAGTNVVLLNTGDIGGSRLTSHHGILRVILEVTTAEGVTHNVQGRCQQHIGTIFLHLLSHGGTHLFYELSVPCRGQQRSDGEMRAIVGSRVTLTRGVDT